MLSRLRFELNHIFVDWDDRKAVLDAGVAVEDHAEIGFEIAAAFCCDIYAFFRGGHGEPLALDSARLHVLLKESAPWAL